MGMWIHTATAKVLGIGALALLMTIPLLQVSGLVAERQVLRSEAIKQIAQGWGGDQVLGGPVLVVPTRRLATPEGAPPQWREGSETVLADTLHLAVALATSTRQYGIYAAPVFVATAKLQTVFRAEDIAQFRAASAAAWQGGKAELRLPLADLRGLQQVEALTVDGKPARFESSAARFGAWPVVVVPIDLDALGSQPITVAATLKLAGTGSLQLLPLARNTDVSMRAPWRDPGFTGAALPLERSIGPGGFSAHWHLLDLNRSYGQHWNDGDGDVAKALPASAFGVQLYQPVDVYQRNVRAGKYGLLFVAMTFVVFFLFEVLQRLRVHPVQYLLVGMALATFYLVLLALSEQIGFGAAYAIAAVAVAAMVGSYGAAVLRAWRAGALLGGVVALIYTLLYGLIAAEQYALLVGALVLLVTVALLMYLTRRVDWYAYTSSLGVAPAAIMDKP